MRTRRSSDGRGRLVAAVVVALLVGCTPQEAAERAPTAPPATDPGPVESPPVPGDAFLAHVVRVVDGDTVLAAVPGQARRFRVRLIGVDTPESVKPGTPVACYGREASGLTERLVSGATVRAAYEPGGRQDRFGRELWDVWLPDGRFLQAVLVAAGAARPYPYRPQVRYARLLGQLGEAARAARRGLWGAPCNGRSFA